MYNISWFHENYRNLISYVRKEVHPVYEVRVSDVPLVWVYELNKSTLQGVAGWGTSYCLSPDECYTKEELIEKIAKGEKLDGDLVQQFNPAPNRLPHTQ